MTSIFLIKIPRDQDLLKVYKDALSPAENVCKHALYPLGDVLRLFC